jgi:hypothetical protein
MSEEHHTTLNVQVLNGNKTYRRLVSSEDVDLKTFTEKLGLENKPLVALDHYPRTGHSIASDSDLAAEIHFATS